MKARHQLVRVRWLLAVAAMLLLVADRLAVPLTQPLEFIVSDALLAAHAERSAPAPGIALINIDERSLEQMASDFGRWPWPRSVHAELLENILAQQPRAVVFDIMFTDYDTQHPAGDKYLIDVAVPAKNVFFPLHVLPESDAGPALPLDEWGYRLGFEKTAAAQPGAELDLVPSLRPLTETGRVGAISVVEDSDGALRRYALYFQRAGWRVPSLPAKVAQYLDVELPAGADIILHWDGRPEDREQYSYVDVFRDLAREKSEMSGGLFTDTIVIIGGNAPSLYDLKVTPVSNVHPGADILATAIGDLVQGDWLRPAPAALVLLAGLLLLAAVAGCFHAGHGLRGGAAVVIGGALVWTLLSWLLLDADWLLPLTPVLLYPVLLYVALGLHQTLHERAAREQAVSTFGRFIDPRVVASLIREDSDVLHAPPESREITVLFSDIRGFTTLSETRPPEEIVDLLNRYFGRQVEVIFRFGGTIDKFIGDAIMAFWGAPVANPEQAAHAVRAALEMTRVVREFRAELAATGVDFDIGIGLHTGPAVVGFIGADHRLDYTAIGDTVNLASRIEGQTKGVARVLVSGETRRRCGGAFTFIDHGEFNVKGRAQAVHLYEPQDEREQT
ncbi:MAG TPA: adenylate/guanylate cyclase domain-containing protein [Gammaproteobacteria bacterium]